MPTNDNDNLKFYFNNAQKQFLDWSTPAFSTISVESGQYKKLQDELAYLRSTVERLRERERGMCRLLLAAIRTAGKQGLRVDQAALYSVGFGEEIPKGHYNPQTNEYIYVDAKSSEQTHSE